MARRAAPSLVTVLAFSACRCSGSQSERVANDPPGASRPVQPGPSVSNDALPPTGCQAGGVVLAGGAYVPSKFARTDGKPRPVEALCVDRREVTVDQYRRCVANGGCPVPTDLGPGCNWAEGGRERHPMNCVTQGEASGYCRSIGTRLPTEVEWEWIARARGKESSYPWGSDAPGERACWSGVNPRVSTCEVGTHPSGATLDGVEDLAGNVYEWTSDRLHGCDEPCKGVFVIRGGGFEEKSSDGLLVFVQDKQSENRRTPDVGFRCVRPTS